MDNQAELDAFDVTVSEAPEAVEVEAPKAPRKRKPKTPAAPTLAERVAHLEPLPWNALRDELVTAHNALLRAIQEAE